MHPDFERIEVAAAAAWQWENLFDETSEPDLCSRRCIDLLTRWSWSRSALDNGGIICLLSVLLAGREYLHGTCLECLDRIMQIPPLSESTLPSPRFWIHFLSNKGMDPKFLASRLPSLREHQSRQAHYLSLALLLSYSRVGLFGDAGGVRPGFLRGSITHKKHVRQHTLFSILVRPIPFHWSHGINQI